MANEATINSSLQLNVGELEYRNQPSSFTADVSAAGGPTPGQIVATTAGVDVDFSALATPGLCRIQNLDSTNFVSVGIWDGTAIFFPLMELLPGESYIVRLARDLGEEFGVGTGTTGAGNNSLRVKADTASVKVLVEAFLK